MNGVKALVFDVFGTVVDWREGVAREAAILRASRVPASAGTGARIITRSRRRTGLGCDRLGFCRAGDADGRLGRCYECSGQASVGSENSASSA